MNISKPLQQRQQQQQYAPGPNFIASSSTGSLSVPLGRPLPKTPGSVSSYPLPPSSIGTGSTNDYVSQQQQQQQQAGVAGRGVPPALNKRHSNVNIHIAQPTTSSPPVSNSPYPPTYSHRQNRSWVQPKAASSVNLLAGTSATATGSMSIDTSTNSAGRRLSMQEELMSPSYHQALTRPISPSVILNYKFPPATSSASTGTSTSPTNSMSPNISNISSSSTVNAPTPVPTQNIPGNQAPSMLSQTPQSQASQSQSLQSQTPQSKLTSTPAASGYGANMKRDLGYQRGASFSGSMSSNALMTNTQQPVAPTQTAGVTSPTPLRHNNFGASGTASATSTISARQMQQQNRRGPLLPVGDDSSSLGEADVEPVVSSSGGSNFQPSLPSASIQVAKEGWLWRRGNLLTWKRCYAIGRYRGDGQPGMLTLFKDNEHMFPIKTFDLADCYEVQVKSADTKGTTRFEFKLVTRKEETWFGTDTMTERTGWIDAINALMTARGANVGASLSKLEAKLNTIRHRNNSHEYTSTTLSSPDCHPHKRQISAGPSFGATSTVPITSTPSIPPASLPHAGIIEEQLQIMQQELQTREQVLSKREHEIEQKRIESLLVQLKAWRGACKVTVNQQYSVRDQLLEKFMKTPRTVQDLVDRAKIHLDTGADQISQMVNSHWDCLSVYDAGGGGFGGTSSVSSATTITILGLHRQLFRELKQILLDLTINLDTRCSEIQRALLVVETHLASFSHRDRRSRQLSDSSGSTYSGGMKPDQGTPGPPLSNSAYAAAEESIKSVRRRYTDTHEALNSLSQKIKAGLNRQQQMHHEVSGATMTSFREEMQEHLKSLRLPTFAFVSCIPDQPLLFTPMTGHANDVQPIVPPKDISTNPNSEAMEEQLEKADEKVQNMTQANTPSAVSERPASALSNKEAAGTPAPSTRPHSFSPLGPRQSPFEQKERSASRPASMAITPDTPADSSVLPLPKGLSSLLLSQTSSPTLAPTGLPVQPPAQPTPPIDTMEITQKMRDLVMPEFDHLSTKQQETLKSLTTLLSELSNSLMAKLGEIKEASQAQRQEFDELKDEIIDVMQLSATDPSSTQRDMSALSDIRSKLADISNQLSTVQNSSALNYSNNGSIVLGSGTGAGGLQRSMSTMIHHPSGHFSQYQAVDRSIRGRFPESGSMVTGGVGGGGGLDSVYGRASAFGSVLGSRPRSSNQMRAGDQDGTDAQRSPEIISKLDHLLLLLEFVNTAQCRLMAYQELEHERQNQNGNIDDGRMMAVQEHMVEMDRKMNLQMSLLGRLLQLQEAYGEQSTTTECTARVTELTCDDSVDEQDLGANPLPLARLHDSFSAADSLILTQVLERLDTDLIPSFRAQEERVQELASHITDLQKLLEEQQQLQQQQQQQQVQNTPQRTQSNASHYRVLTAESNSVRASTPQSPIEPDSPALWRASLRPSRSNGSTIAKERHSTLAHCASSPSLPGSFSTTSLTGGASSPLMTPNPSYKTSERILEIVERLEARLGKISPGDNATEQTISQQQQQQLVEQIHGAVSDVKSDNKELLQNLKSFVTEQMDQQELSQVGTKALLKEIMASLTELHAHRAVSSQAQQQWLKELKSEMEAIFRMVQSKSSSREPSTTSTSPIPSVSSSTPPMVVLDASEAGQYWKEPLQKVQDMLVAESDRAEASWNEHRDEVALKVDTILSRLDDAEVSRDGELSEGLAEMREWIVRHSAMQTENLRSIVEMLATEMKGIAQNNQSEDSYDKDAHRQQSANAPATVEGISRQSSIKSTQSQQQQQQKQQQQQEADKFQELKDQLEMASRVQMATFSEMADNLAGVEKMIRDMSQVMGIRRGGTILRKREQEASRAMLAMEVKETIQELMSGSGSTGSLVDHTPSATSGRTEPSSGGSAQGHSTASGGSGFGGLFGGSSTSSLNLGLLSSFGRGSSGQSTQPGQNSRRSSLDWFSRDSVASSDPEKGPQAEAVLSQQHQHQYQNQHQQQQQLLLLQQQSQWLEALVKELHTRKNGVEQQIERLDREKAQLEAEKAQLAHEVELLRRERLNLLLASDPRDSTDVPLTETSNDRKQDPLEGLLVDRVSMLLQETARLEALKRQLDNEVHARLDSRTTSSLPDHDGDDGHHDSDIKSGQIDHNEYNNSVATTTKAAELAGTMGAADYEENEDLVLVDKKRPQQWSPQTPSPRSSSE